MKSGLNALLVHHRSPELGGVMTRKPIPGRHATDEYQIIVRGNLSHQFQWRSRHEPED